MIIWDDITYNNEKSKQSFNELTIEKLETFKVEEKYERLREMLIESRDKVFDDHSFDLVEKLGYDFDLTFGLELYSILINEFAFKLRYASKDDIWRFLQLNIIPDIVYSRWGFNEDRFYKKNRRIWLKTIWWYIHLSWNKDKETTYNILKNNTTDTIMQLVERPGLGYNIELYREIMKKYGELKDKSQYSRMLFRKILILNTARIMTISPELIEGGIPKYVDNIFENVIKLG